MAALCLAALFPLFASLDGDHLWADEGDTAVLAVNIKKFGVPKAWDGTAFIDSDQGRRENEHLVMVSHPWVQYYVTAVSFALLGETTFAARLPFALAGWLTLVAAYVLILRLTGDRRAGLSACFLLLVSVQFLLYARQSRNYALAMLLTLVTLLAFFRMQDRKTALQFALMGALLFHTHPAAVAPLAALGVLTLAYRPLHRLRKWYWLAAPVIGLLILPWLLMVRAEYSVNTLTPKTLTEVMSRTTQFAIECASVTPLLGAVGLLTFVWWRWRRESRRLATVVTGSKTKRNQQRQLAEAREKLGELLPAGNQVIVVLVATLLAAYGVLMIATQSTVGMWGLGLRQVAAIIPLTAILMGVLVARVSGSNLKVWLALMLVLCGTKLGRLTPWPWGQSDDVYFEPKQFAATHKPQDWEDGVLRTGLVGFYRDLWRQNPGTVSELCDFVRKHTSPEDVLITNYDWEPLYFHTRRPLGLTIFPEYQVTAQARKHALPEYVFSVERAKWLIWRPAWDGYQGYDRDRIFKLLVARGARLEFKTNVTETLWENRENVHFRRFPDNDHKFVWYTNMPPAQIFRIHWPEEGSGERKVARR
jgi:4-amino-4-deoxy-L-arabinose transferase-like glycosyltransferase